VSVPFQTFADASFQNELAGFLEQASTESVKRFGGYTVKGGAHTFEPRETVDPYLITQLLMPILEVRNLLLGYQVHANTTIFSSLSLLLKD
jgi:hypothetical protein